MRCRGGGILACLDQKNERWRGRPPNRVAGGTSSSGRICKRDHPGLIQRWHISFKRWIMKVMRSPPRLLTESRRSPLPSSGRAKSGIKIIGDGRIYTTKELARAIIEKE
jgi:hypothetical protein